MMKTPHLKISAPICAEYEKILTPDALAFTADLLHRFEDKRQELLQDRKKRQAHLQSGGSLDFLTETASIRNDLQWQVAAQPADLQDRRVEITGPVDRKMVINALNAGARVFMADFEDSNTPLWSNQIQGQINLYDAIRKTITLTTEVGKHYHLNDQTAVLMVRPRGWHLNERHVTINQKPISGAIFDFALYFFHNAKMLLTSGSGPYFYLPKIESYLEARLWNDIFVASQENLGIPQGSIKATVLIETITAAFEMEEILYELREHSAGLNAGRWDYIFSCIKNFSNQADFCLANRNEITMQVPFMQSYALLLLKTCHKRGAPAIGGMNAQIPVKNDPLLNQRAIDAVHQDKTRAAYDGYDGGWVAHPGLVSTAMEAFDSVLEKKLNQIDKQRDDIQICATDLLNFSPETPITELGLRMNINVSIQYLGAWLKGNGCVPIHNLMEDAATAEISRTQLWQWIRSPKGKLDDGRNITLDLCRHLIQEELQQLKQELGEKNFATLPYDQAAQQLDHLISQDPLIDFLTLQAYDILSDLTP